MSYFTNNRIIIDVDGEVLYRYVGDNRPYYYSESYYLVKNAKFVTKMHRLGGAAKLICSYQNEGSFFKKIQEYWVEGLCHREGMPAIIKEGPYLRGLHYAYFKKDSNLKIEEYRQCGQRHRVDGPAVLYYEEGQIVAQEYWLDGHRLLSEKTYEIALKRYK